MRLPFYIKIFFTFLIFFLFLFAFFLNSFYNYHSSYIQTNNQQISKTILENQEDKLLNFLDVYRQKISIVESTIDSLKTQDDIFNFIKNRVLNDKNILEFKSLGFNSKDRYILQNSQNSNLRLQTNYNKEYFKTLRTLNLNEEYIFLDENNKNILNFAIRAKKEFFILKIDMRDFFTNQNEKLIFLNRYEIQESIDLNDFIYKRVDLNDSDFYLFLVKKDKESYKYFLFNNFSNLLYVTLFLSLIFSVITTLLIAENNKKIETKKEELDISNQEYNDILNKNSEIMDRYILFIRVDFDGVIRDISSAFSSFLGYSKSELLGHKYKRLINRNLKKVIKKTVEKSYVNKSLSLKNIQGFKKNGDRFFVDIFVEIINDEFEQYLNIICIDSTDKMKIEDLYFNLNNQVQIYNSIFENVHSGIALLNKDFKFIKVNSQLCEFLGYEEIELIRLSPLNLILSDSKKELKKLLNAMSDLIKVQKIEKIFIKKDGSKIHLELSLRLLREKEQIIFIVNSLEDKRVLQELNLNLETRIKQELAKSKAKEKIHLEEQIKSAKLSYIGSLAAGITHEINTPLTYVKGNLELMTYDINDLEDTKIKERMLQDSKKIKDGIDRIANIVESMREVTHSKASNKEKINIYQTIQTALTIAQNRAKHISKIYLNDTLFDLDDKTIFNKTFYFYGQKQKIEQVWIIIINNALDELEKIEDYDKRWLKIEVSTFEKDIIIRFKDSAGGIKNEAMKKLFEPFNSQKEKGGMGIGLSIAKNIIEENGGLIDAYNGEFGAIFEIRLKILKEDIV